MDFEKKDVVAVMCWVLVCCGMMLWMHLDSPRTMVVIDHGAIPAVCETNGYGSPECHAEMYVRLNARLDAIEKTLKEMRNDGRN